MYGFGFRSWLRHKAREGAEPGSLIQIMPAMTSSMTGLLGIRVLADMAMPAMSTAMTAVAQVIEGALAEAMPAMTTSMTGTTAAQRTDLVAITRFTDTTGNYPADVLGPALKWCWAGGGGGTTNTSSGGAGGFSEDAAYVYAANEAWSIIVGTGGAVGGGTGGDTSIDASCVAKGAVGTTGGSTTGAAGTTTLAGLSGTVAAGAQSGAPSHGSSTAASGSTPGEPNGGAVQAGASAAKIPGSGGRSGTSVQVAGAAGLAVLMYEQLAAANFPGLEGLSLTRSTGTSHSVTVPAGDSADQVLYIVASDGAPTIDVGSGAATSVTSVAHGTDGKLEVFRYTGASPPTSVTTSVSETINVVVLRLNAAGTPEGTATSSSGANAAAATHAPSGGNGDYRVITVLSRADFATAGNITGRPAGFDYSVFLPAQALGPAASSSPDLCVAWDDAAVVGNAGGGNWTNTSASCCVATITIAKV